MRQVNKFLVLVCILREYNFTRQGVIEYNCICLKDSIHKIFAVDLPKRDGAYGFNPMDDDEYDDEASGFANVNTDEQNGSRPNSRLTNYLMAHKFNNKLPEDSS